MTEIIDIGKERRRIIRREARAEWLSKLHIEIRLQWPNSPLGWFIAMTYFVVPVGLVILAIRLAHARMRWRS